MFSLSSCLVRTSISPRANCNLSSTAIFCALVSACASFSSSSSLSSSSYWPRQTLSSLTETWQQERASYTHTGPDKHCPPSQKPGNKREQVILILAQANTVLPHRNLATRESKLYSYWPRQTLSSLTETWQQERASYTHTGPDKHCPPSQKPGNKREQVILILAQTNAVLPHRNLATRESKLYSYWPRQTLSSLTETWQQERASYTHTGPDKRCPPSQKPGNKREQVILILAQTNTVLPHRNLATRESKLYSYWPRQTLSSLTETWQQERASYRAISQ